VGFHINEERVLEQLYYGDHCERQWVECYKLIGAELFEEANSQYDEMLRYDRPKVKFYGLAISKSITVPQNPFLSIPIHSYPLGSIDVYY